MLAEFTGTIEQLPPAFSALKINGKRAYELAREGKSVELQPRQIQIYELQLLDFDFPNFKLKVCCGSGTYIRSLGRDLGVRLGTSAIMTELTRTAIGPFKSAEGVDTPRLDELLEGALLSPKLALAEMPTIELTQGMISGLLDGVMVRVADVRHQFPENESACREFAAVDNKGKLICLLQRHKEKYLRPKINFARYWKDQSSAGASE